MSTNEKSRYLLTTSQMMFWARYTNMLFHSKVVGQWEAIKADVKEGVGSFKVSETNYSSEVFFLD